MFELNFSYYSRGYSSIRSAPWSSFTDVVFILLYVLLWLYGAMYEGCRVRVFLAFVFMSLMAETLITNTDSSVSLLLSHPRQNQN